MKKRIGLLKFQLCKIRDPLNKVIFIASSCLKAALSFNGSNAGELEVGAPMSAVFIVAVVAKCSKVCSYLDIFYVS